jgi:tRNA U34 5-carboxymethylaminomethyl modifying GTPase MnmE/TrmE
MRAKNCIATADLVVLVGDATQHSQRKLPVAIANGALSLDAISKCDLLPTPTPAHAGCIHTSALANLGIELLQERIVRELVPRLPPAGEAVPFEESQGSAIADALQAILRHDSAIAARTITGLLEA